jgi:hypothetical protein
MVNVTVLASAGTAKTLRVVPVAVFAPTTTAHLVVREWKRYGKTAFAAVSLSKAEEVYHLYVRMAGEVSLVMYPTAVLGHTALTTACALYPPEIERTNGHIACVNHSGWVEVATSPDPEEEPETLT